MSSVLSCYMSELLFKLIVSTQTYKHHPVICFVFPITDLPVYVPIRHEEAFVWE